MAILKEKSKVEQDRTLLMKLPTFGFAERITILSFLNNFRLACDSNRVHQDTAMWLLNQFLKKPASAVQNAYTCLNL